MFLIVAVIVFSGVALTGIGLNDVIQGIIKGKHMGFNPLC